MTMTGSPSRQDRRPDWLQRKHGQRPVNPKMADWADGMAEELYGRWDQAVPIGPFRTEQAARSAKNALYDAVYKRRNARRQDEPLSLSANVTNPEDGRCYARGSCRCEQNGCKPTPGPGWFIHARLYEKSQGRAHQGAKPRDQWDYDPMAPRSRQAARDNGHTSGAPPAAEDEAPARIPRSRPKPPPAKPAAKTAATAEAESFAAKLRRWSN